jgi:hypothetical protein
MRGLQVALHDQVLPCLLQHRRLPEGLMYSIARLVHSGNRPAPAWDWSQHRIRCSLLEPGMIRAIVIVIDLRLVLLLPCACLPPSADSHP